MRAAIYVRVSTEEQASEGYSIEAQKAKLRQYCAAQMDPEPWDVVAVYEDDGYSGRNTKRPAYEKMIEEFDNWDVLVILKMDRIHRNSRNFIEMIDFLGKKGKDFVSAQDAMDTKSPMGRFLMTLIQGMAQLESEEIGLRTSIAMEEKARSMNNTEKESRTMGFNAPYGYLLDKGILVSVPDELAVVSEIFDEYLTGSTMDSIAFTLNRRDQLTRKGNPWNVYNLRNVLHNPIYAGYMRWGKVLIRHFAQTAVSPDDFNRTQELISSKIRDPKKKKELKVPGFFE
jgi:DNA invertase Pin-like site-specific DNA recombinase